MKVGRPGRGYNGTLAHLVLPKAGNFLCDWNVRAEVMFIKNGRVFWSLVDYDQSSHSYLLSRNALLRAASRSRDRMPVLRRISPRHVMLQLPLDVAQQPAGAKAEHLRSQPRRAQFLFNHRQPFDRLLGGTNSARWFEAHRHSRLLRILANRARHYQPYRQRRIRRLFPRRGFDEVGTRQDRKSVV